MKSRRLPENELANLAFKPHETKRRRLISLEKPKKIPGSYEPFRRHNGDALNEQYPLLDEPLDPTSLATLEAVVGRACKGDPELLAMNIPIAKATHTYAVKHEIKALREDVRPLTLPFAHSYTFGMNMLIAYGDGRIVAANADLRRNDPLTATGRRFLFSAMHHRWRENYPDLQSIGLENWRYANDDARTVSAMPCTEQDLISYEAILADVRQTYEIWHEVLRNAETGRRRIAGDDGPLFAAR